MQVDSAPPIVILGVAASDSHSVANQLFAMGLAERGFKVVNLGACTPLEQFADALDQHPEALAIGIGSLNGHAYKDLRQLPELRASGRLCRPVIVGGNLSVGCRSDVAARDRIRGLGVDFITSSFQGLVNILKQIASDESRLDAGKRDVRQSTSAAGI
jgi:methylaspartate mutase sigma subunit